MLAADALYALAIALDGTDAAHATAKRALALYEEKGNVVEASQARALTEAAAVSRTASTVE